MFFFTQEVFMDLHDYRDVAQNYDRYLEVMYEKENAHKGFQEFYLSFAKKYGSGGVVDIACGTGAVLLYLAEHGIMADGSDVSEEMCNVCGKKAKNLGYNLNLYPANMINFHSDRKYSLEIIARSGFMHLSTPQDQKSALLNLREQLEICDFGRMWQRDCRTNSSAKNASELPAGDYVAD